MNKSEIYIILTSLSLIIVNASILVALAIEHICKNIYSSQIIASKCP